MTSDVKELIEEARDRRGWSYRELAAKLGTSHQRLLYYAKASEHDKRGHKTIEFLRLLCRLRRVLRISWTQLGARLDEKYDGKE